MSGDTKKRILIVGLVSLAVCGLIVLGTATQNYVDITMRQDRSASFWLLARWPAFWWAGWVFLAPAVFELGWRRPIERPHALRNAGILALGCVAASLIHDAYQVGTMFLPPYHDNHETLSETIGYHVVSSLYLNLFIFWAVVGLAHGFKAYQRSHARALDAARLETELATARLDVLRMQLHPHFLFNTLNGISALMYRDVETADAMISKLSRLLRRALDRSDVHEVTLEEEMDFLREYLSIEQMRFDDALETDIDVENGLHDVLVPTFVFQPLVENSIKHGIVARGNRGRIEIRAYASNRLFLQVSDNGPGLEGGGDPLTSGVGLSNLVDRLERLYGDDYRIQLDCTGGEGLTVCLNLPLRYSSRESVIRHSQPALSPTA